MAMSHQSLGSLQLALCCLHQEISCPFLHDGRDHVQGNLLSDLEVQEADQALNGADSRRGVYRSVESRNRVDSSQFATLRQPCSTMPGACSGAEARMPKPLLSLAFLGNVT